MFCFHKCHIIHIILLNAGETQPDVTNRLIQGQLSKLPISYDALSSSSTPTDSSTGFICAAVRFKRNVLYTFSKFSELRRRWQSCKTTSNRAIHPQQEHFRSEDAREIRKVSGVARHKMASRFLSLTQTAA